MCIMGYKMIHGRWTGYIKSEVCDRMFFGKLSVILADGFFDGFCINLKLHKENVMWILLVAALPVYIY